MTPTLNDFAAQGSAVQGLIHSLQEGNAVHAYLISGSEGVGKRTLANLTAMHVLCRGENGKRPCGECPACLQFQAGTHPDVTYLIPGVRLGTHSASKSKQIVVDDIRSLVEIAGQRTFENGVRVFIIQDCDKMNPSAANALLKTLEEPKQDVLFLLLTTKPEALLPTIISRCRTVRLHPWPDETVRHVLQEQGGIPDIRIENAVRAAEGSIGRAKALATDEEYWRRRDEIIRDFLGISARSDIFAVSTAWKERKEDAEGLLNDLQDMLQTMINVRLGLRDERLIEGFPPEWRKAAAEAPVERLIKLIECIREARWMRANNVTLQAVIERILLRLMEEKTRWLT